MHPVSNLSMLTAVTHGVYYKKMLGSLSKLIKDTSTLRRLLFAVASLPPKTPNFWGIVIEYAYG